MNRRCRTAVAILALSAGTAFVRAEGSGDPEARQAWIDARVKKMTDELALTPAQQTAVRAALQAQQDKLEALRLEEDQKRRALLDESDQAVGGALSPEQKEKYAKMKENMNQKDAEGPEAGDHPRGAGGRRGGRGGMGGGMGSGGWGH